jgi:hypothetical protein
MVITIVIIITTIATITINHQSPSSHGIEWKNHHHHHHHQPSSPPPSLSSMSSSFIIIHRHQLRYQLQAQKGTGHASL